MDQSTCKVSEWLQKPVLSSRANLKVGPSIKKPSRPLRDGATRRLDTTRPSSSTLLGCVTPTASKIPPSRSPQYSPLPSDIAARLKASLESPEFVKKRNSFNMEKAIKDAKKHPRCRFSRKLMTGYECRCCKDFYDAMGLEGKERAEYVNKVSKHRAWEEPPPTPPRYWDLDTPTKEEAIQLKYVIETDSPLFKKKSTFYSRLLLKEKAKKEDASSAGVTCPTIKSSPLFKQKKKRNY